MEKNKGKKKDKDFREDDIIIQLIKKETIVDQQGLVDRLKELEVNIPQSTLSRRLKRLGIAKINNSYVLIEEQKNIHFKLLAIKLSPPNLIVLHTLPGHASQLAIWLDQKINKSSNVNNHKLVYGSLIGTIAGDDTVLVITDGSHKGIEKIKGQIETDLLMN